MTERIETHEKTMNQSKKQKMKKEKVLEFSNEDALSTVLTRISQMCDSFDILNQLTYEEIFAFKAGEVSPLSKRITVSYALIYSLVRSLEPKYLEAVSTSQITDVNVVNGLFYALELICRLRWERRIDEDLKPTLTKIVNERGYPKQKTFQIIYPILKRKLIRADGISIDKLVNQPKGQAYSWISSIMNKKLTIKQKRFVDFFDGNGTEAAREAGYKGNDDTLAHVASENLRKPHIREAIDARENRRNGGTIMTREERQSFWSRVADGDEGGMTGEMVRLRASEILGKSQADFVERHEYDHTGEINITVKTVNYDKDN